MFFTPVMGKIITVSTALIMLLGIKSPLCVVVAYLALRPIMTPYTTMGYTFLGLPLSSLPSLILLIAAIKASIFSNNGTLRIKNLYVFCSLLFIMVLASLNSLDYYSSLHFILQYITAICSAIIAYNAVNKVDDLFRFFKAISISSLFPILFGFYQKYTGYVFPWLEKNTILFSGNRLTSIISQYNEYGIYLSFIIVILMCIIISESFTKSSFIWYAILLMAIASWILSLNRGSWISLSIASICGAIVFFRKVKFRFYVIAGAIIIVLAFPIIISRFNQLSETSSWGGSQNTMSMRLSFWMQLMEASLESIYFGWGPGSSKLISAKFFKKAHMPHNDYLRILLETGIFGLFTYILFLIKNLLDVLIRINDNKNWNIHYSFLVLITYFIIISLTQNIISNVFLFPLFLSLLSAYNKANYIIDLADRTHGDTYFPLDK